MYFATRGSQPYSAKTTAASSSVAGLASRRDVTQVRSGRSVIVALAVDGGEGRLGTSRPGGETGSVLRRDVARLDQPLTVHAHHVVDAAADGRDAQRRVGAGAG